MQRYNPIEIEKKWQEVWDREGTYTVDFSDHSKPKYYGMSMLPGITGAGIHIGHGRTFQFSDIKVRAKRQQGFNAYNPIGWDSFGLPVENYAIKIGKKPREAHEEAKANFIMQLKRLGYSYDWTKEISTADPSYYKWTQWIFNKLYEHGLAYQKESAQWWCETDQTVLANEQVEGGKCWRCGNPVTKKNLKQWFFKITEYADEMLEATNDLNWTEMVKTMQKNWIGRSIGAEVDFGLENNDEKITVFTTRPDTLFGATFIVLAPEHPLVKEITNADKKSEVDAYIKQASAKSEIERQETSRDKTGVFTGAYAVNPVNGEQVPVWIADYVLTGYGTGAIMAVPAHDERDHAFAEKFDLPIKQVVAEYVLGTGRDTPRDGLETLHRPVVDAIITDGDGNYLLQIENEHHVHFVGGGIDDTDKTTEDALRREIIEEVGFTDIVSVKQAAPYSAGMYLRETKNRNQKVWGTFFEVVVNPLVQIESEIEQGLHSVEWVKKEEIAKRLTWTGHQAAWQAYLEGRILDSEVREGLLVNSNSFDGMHTEEAREKIVADLSKKGVAREKVNYKMRDWLISRQRYWGAPIPMIHCEKDGTVPVPDDQLPVVLPDVEDYKPKGGATSVLATVEDWVNVDCPKCGGPAKRETDTMDGYACSSWYFLRYLDPFNDTQAWDPTVEAHWGPVDFYNGADHAVAHLLYSRFWMRFFHTLGLVSTPEPFSKMMYNGYIMAADGQKMSKSKGNVIDPLEIMDSGYGADSLRVYEMFIAPYDLEAPWDTRGVPGTYRFLNRAWTLTQEYLENEPVTLGEQAQKEILTVAHKMVKKVTEDIESDKFNTAVSAMMEAVNSYYKLKETHGIGKSDTWEFAIESLLQVLAPFAPHITEELWSQLGHDTTIHIDAWPKWDKKYLQSDEITIIVQVNGKLRSKLVVPTDSSEEDIIATAKADEKIAEHLQQNEVRKTIYVPHKLVNFVV
jgi:leucyl-tRNA synthetase